MFIAVTERFLRSSALLTLEAGQRHIVRLRPLARVPGYIEELQRRASYKSEGRN